MKYDGHVVDLAALVSRPARGAWIEIALAMCLRLMIATSRPARGAWIEILRAAAASSRCLVAPRKGCVD